MKTKFTNFQKQLHNLRWGMQNERLDLRNKFKRIRAERKRLACDGSIDCDEYCENVEDIDDEKYDDFMCSDSDCLMFGLASLFLRIREELSRVESNIMDQIDSRLTNLTPRGEGGEK